MSSKSGTSDAWDPGQYDRFASERSQPFYDLRGLVEGRGQRRVLDLGCGTGALTGELHRWLGAEETTGIDNSPAMLAEASARSGRGLVFVEGDLRRPPADPRSVDLVFSNAALQWVPDHPGVLADWVALLVDHGELAVQVPANVDHLAHRLIAEIAAAEPFASAGDGPPPPDPVRSVLKPEAYAELLFDLGFYRQHVRLQVYGHVLPSTRAVVEWTKGTSLTRIKSHLPPEAYEEFVATYTRRLVETLGDRSPYFYPFKRILLWAAR